MFQNTDGAFPAESQAVQTWSSDRAIKPAELRFRSLKKYQKAQLDLQSRIVVTRSGPVCRVLGLSVPSDSDVAFSFIQVLVGKVQKVLITFEHFLDFII